MNTTGARERVLAKVREYSALSKSAAAGLSISEESKAVLSSILDMLVPEGSSAMGAPTAPNVATVAL